MIRTLAVSGVFLVATGMGLPAGASAQTSAQGQAVGILFLLGASKTGAQAKARTPSQKPKSGIAASPDAQRKIVDMRPKPLAVEDRIVLVRAGGGTERLADHGTVLRVTADQRNGRNLDRPVEAADRTHAKHD